LTVELPEDISAETMSVDFMERKSPFFALSEQERRSYAAILAVPYDTKPAMLPATVHFSRGGQPHTQVLNVQVVDGQYPSEALRVAGKFTNLSKKDLARIKRENQLLAAVYAKTTPAKLWTGPFLAPMDSALTSHYGTKRVFNGERQSWHSGVDFRAKKGTKIFASASGVVLLAKDLFFSGRTVIVDHGFNVFTIYAHMSKMKVKAGQRVKAKDFLGLSGQTGRVSGPHLHWQAYVNHAKVNPLDLMKVLR